VVGGDGHGSVLNAGELVVGEAGDGGGEEVFQAPASLLAGVVVAVPGDGEEIDDAADDGLERGGEVGEADSEVGHDPPLEASVINENGAAGAALSEEGFGKGEGGIPSGEVEKGGVVEVAIFREVVEAELKGDGLVGPAALPDGNGEGGGLEIKESGRGRVRGEVGGGSGGIEPRLTGEAGVFYALLPHIEEVVGDFPVIGDAEGNDGGETPARQMGDGI